MPVEMAACSMIPRYHTTYSTADFSAALASVAVPPKAMFQARWLGMEEQGVETIPMLRGREALFAILRALPLAPGARVGVPLFVCSCVARTIAEAGFEPLFLDSDPDHMGLDLEDLKRKVHRLDAMVLVYTLGRPIDVTAVREMLGAKPLIEDCAHALGSTYKGQALGTHGDAGFFSFGFFKPVPAGGGGLIVTRQVGLADRIRRAVATAPRESMTEEMRHCVRNLVSSRAFQNPVYSVALKLRGRHEDEPPSEPSQCRMIASSLGMRWGDLIVIQRQLARLQGDATETEDLFGHLRASLPNGWHMPSQPVDGHWNEFMCGVCAPDGRQRTAAIKALRRCGIAAAELFPHCRQESKWVGYAGDCPQAEMLSDTAFTVPLRNELPRAQRERVLTCIPEVIGTL